MRIRIVFSLKNKGAYVPFHHQQLLSDFIQDLLKRNLNEFSGYENYNFSGLKGQTKVSKKGLHFFSSRVTLVISAQDPTFIDHLVQLIFRQNLILLGNLELEPELVEKENHPELGDAVKYVCISPLVLIRPNQDPYASKKFIIPDSDTFSDYLYENTMFRLERSNYSLEQISSFFKFQIVPDKDYLDKIKRDEKKFARIYQVEEDGVLYELRGYTFPFILYAAPEVQKFIFECGLGAFTNRGFGMLDLANQNPIQRTTLYLPNKVDSMMY